MERPIPVRHEGADRIQVGDVELAHLDRRIARRGAQFGRHRPGGGGTPGGDGHRSPGLGQRPDRLQADPAGATRDDHGLSGQVHALQYFGGGGGEAVIRRDAGHGEMFLS
jgi:hypothetical protein